MTMTHFAWQCLCVLAAVSCLPHTWRCGALVDVQGLHDLTCKAVSSPPPRQSGTMLSTTSLPALFGIPATKEPTGLTKSWWQAPWWTDLKNPGKVVNFWHGILEWSAHLLPLSSMLQAIEAVVSQSLLPQGRRLSIPIYHSLLFQPIALETLDLSICACLSWRIGWAAEYSNWWCSRNMCLVSETVCCHPTLEVLVYQSFGDLVLEPDL